MQLCEMGSCIQEVWFREIRRLMDKGHQTSIISTHPSLQMTSVAKDMFSRWTQENYFKYVIDNFDLDYMMNYNHQDADTNIKIVNPQYRELTNKIKKINQLNNRAHANISQMTNTMDINTIEPKILEKINQVIEQVKEYTEELNMLREKRKHTSYKITMGELPIENRYHKLNTESKKLKNLIVMLAYRSESTLL